VIQKPFYIWRSETREQRCDRCRWPIRAGQAYTINHGYEDDGKGGTRKVRFHYHIDCPKIKRG